MGITIESHVYYSIEIGGKTVPLITDAVVVMSVVTLVIVLFTVLSTRKLKQVPSGLQKVAESFVELVSNLTKNQMGHHYKVFTPLISTLLLFIGVSNIIAIFNIIPSGEALSKIFNNPELEGIEIALHPPTKNFNVTMCLALTTIIIVIISEFK